MTALSVRKFYPVIHCVDPDLQQGVGHALANIRIAITNGADGVFLIGHGMHSGDLSYIFEHARKQFPGTWLGLNFLDVSSRKRWVELSTTAHQRTGLNALWIDGMPSERLNLPPTIQVFGGVAFKYIDPQLSGDALSQACAKAVKCVDVATTSGDKTGSPPDAAKLKAIKENLGGSIPLAVASGVSSNNVLQLLEYANMFLVASSICARRPELGNNEYLVAEEVRKLADLIHR